MYAVSFCMYKYENDMLPELLKICLLKLQMFMTMTHV